MSGPAATTPMFESPPMRWKALFCWNHMASSFDFECTTILGVLDAVSLMVAGLPSTASGLSLTVSLKGTGPDEFNFSLEGPASGFVEKLGLLGTNILNWRFL